MKTLRLDADTQPGFDQALERLEAGEVVAVPTETVYGLAGDAGSGAAVARIFEAKRRPRFNPLICHVGDRAMAERFCLIGRVAEILASAFWPGPLTIVLPLREDSGIHPLATAGLKTVAVRQPRGILGRLATGLGRPLAAPSANPSGRVSPTTADHVASGLAGRISLILDGGPCSVGVESTIVQPGEDRLVLMRAGAISREALAERTGMPVVSHDPGGGIAAPGQMTSHYAPHGRLRLDATSVEPGEYVIRFGAEDLPGMALAAGIVDLSASGDLTEAAAKLFAALRSFDDPSIERIAVTAVPDTGIGEAINDRLRRAAAPR